MYEGKIIMEKAISQEMTNIITEINNFAIFRKSNETAEKPVLIAAPDGSNAGALRIYGYSGDIGRLPVEGGKVSLLRKDYTKYLSKKIKGGRNRAKWLDFSNNKTDVFPQLFIDKKIGMDDYESILNTFISSVEPSEIWNDQDYRNLYLKLALAAAEVSPKGTKTNGKRGERWVQQLVAKYYQTHNGIMAGKPIIITDVEFDMPISENRILQKRIRNAKNMEKNCEAYIKSVKAKDNIISGGDTKAAGASKPDFIVFDGERFGYVEMKYDGESMDDFTSNGLDWHFLDFYSAMSASYETQLEKYEECLNRLEILLDYGIINEKMEEKDEKIDWRALLNRCKKKLENLKKQYNDKTDCTEMGCKAQEEQLFWVGFVFIGGNKINIANKIKNQLIGPRREHKPFKNTDRENAEKYAAEDVDSKITSFPIYCQYCEDTEDGNIGLDLSKTLEQVCEELVKQGNK